QLLDAHLGDGWSFLEPAGVGEEAPHSVVKSDLAGLEQGQQTRQAGDDLGERGEVVAGVGGDGRAVVAALADGEGGAVTGPAGHLQHRAGCHALGYGAFQDGSSPTLEKRVAAPRGGSSVAGRADAPLSHAWQPLRAVAY